MDITCYALFVWMVDFVVLVGVGALVIKYIALDAFYRLGNEMRKHSRTPKSKQESLFGKKDR